MKKCLLCGRKLNSNENNYGNGCILKCYRLLNMDYKKVKNKETVLNNEIAKISENKNLNNTLKVKLTERYLSLVLLSSVDIAFYDKYKEDIKRSINKKSFIGNELIELKEAYEIYKFYNKFYNALHIKIMKLYFLK